jgi:diphosphomevalonate decarboxylase
LLCVVAVIKYWGKSDVKLNTPMNSSASLTLDQSDLHTITTVAVSKSFSHDQLWLNGKEIEINGRGKTVISCIRQIAQDKHDPATGELFVRKEEWPEYRVRISSVNTFPTGAGLASSAAGLACLVASLAKVFSVKEEFPGQLTAIARQGSGSASRSLFGGFVKWQKVGEVENANDSIAIQIADENVIESF